MIVSESVLPDAHVLEAFAALAGNVVPDRTTLVVAHYERFLDDADGLRPGSRRASTTPTC